MNLFNKFITKKTPNISSPLSWLFDRSASLATYAGCLIKIICAETSPGKFLDGRVLSEKFSGSIICPAPWEPTLCRKKQFGICSIGAFH
jgi:hypothetical protein